MIREKNSFLGTGWGFPPEFPEQGANVAMVSDDEDVHQSLQILLQTAKFTRLMHPEYYCDLQSFVFQDSNYQSQVNMKNEIAKSILNNEPRVDCGEINISRDKCQPNTLLIQVNYTVRSTNSRQNMVFPFYLNEGTNVSLTAEGRP